MTFIYLYSILLFAMSVKINSEKEAVLNIKDQLEDASLKDFTNDVSCITDNVVDDLSNRYDYIQLKNEDYTENDVKIMASTALVEADRQLNTDVYLFIHNGVIGYTTNPIKYRQNKIDGGYELIEVSDAVDMLNKGDRV